MHLTVLAFVAIASASSLQALFGSCLSPDAQIIAASDSNWTLAVQQRWSTWYAPTYSGAIKVATVSDVQHVVSQSSRSSRVDGDADKG